MMHESLHKAALVKQIRAIPGAYARRLEDRYAVGMPDLVIKFPGKDIIFAEGKFIIQGRRFGPTLRQFKEGKKLIAAGLIVLLIAWKESPNGVMQMYISPWCEEASIDDCYFGPGTSTTSAVTLMGFLEDRRLQALEYSQKLATIGGGL